MPDLEKIFLAFVNLIFAIIFLSAMAAVFASLDFSNILPGFPSLIIGIAIIGAIVAFAAEIIRQLGGRW